MKLGVTLDILNQKDTPAFYADTLANRPAAGFTGRVFISTDTLDLYRDTGTTWVLLSPSSTGTITGSGAANQVTYFSSASSITGSNNLFWDSTNFRLGINTNTPGAVLDVHGTQNTILQLNQTSINDTRIAFQLSGSALWRLGNYYNGGANDFELFDVIGAQASITIKKTTGQVLIGTSSVGAGKLVVSSTSSDNGVQIVGANAPSLRLDNSETGATKRVGLGISTAVNNFIQGSVDRDFCIFNGSATSSPMLFGIYGTTNVQEAARISAARNFLVGGTTDNGFKLQVTGDGFISGSLGIGVITNGTQSLRISKTITGATVAYSIFNNGTVQSSVTAAAWNNISEINTVASAFNLSNYYHYGATQGSIGAGSSVTSQFGFFADSGLTGATNNYGFFGNIASGTNRWNLFMNGTANNYMAGSLGIGNSSLDTSMLRISRAFTSTLATSIFLDSQASSTNTFANYIATNANTQAATFTTQIRHISLSQGTFGAGSTVTDQFGIIVNANLIGATNNFALFSDIPSGTGRWNLYINGTAANYINGNLGIGVITNNASAKVQINSTTQGFLPPRMTTSEKNAISTPATGLVIFDTTLGKLCVFSTTWQTITSV